MLTATRIDFEILRMTMFKVKFGVQEKSIWVLKKSLKFVSEKGYSCLACTQTLVVEFRPTAPFLAELLGIPSETYFGKSYGNCWHSCGVESLFFWEMRATSI